MAFNCQEKKGLLTYLLTLEARWSQSTLLLYTSPGLYWNGWLFAG